MYQTRKKNSRLMDLFAIIILALLNLRKKTISPSEISLKNNL